jgi:hypothetical protein
MENLQKNCRWHNYDRIEKTTTATASATNVLIDEYNNLSSIFFFYSIFERKQQTYDTLLSARTCHLSPKGAFPQLRYHCPIPWLKRKNCFCLFSVIKMKGFQIKISFNNKTYITKLTWYNRVMLIFGIRLCSCSS